MESNPLGLDGMDFIEFASPKDGYFEGLLGNLGFKKIAQHRKKKVTLFRQGRINLIINDAPQSFAAKFCDLHGPSICATGFRVKDARHAFKEALVRGAIAFNGESSRFPSIYGIGDSVIYFIDAHKDAHLYEEDFNFFDDPSPQGYGLFEIDHLTNNVPRGEMQKWCNWYQKIFNFRETRYFDIKGLETGLVSKVMRSPCQKITIPINEPTDGKSQIQEYLDEYHGSGIQHVALSTPNIISTVSQLKTKGIAFLDAPHTYFEMLTMRLPQVTEKISELERLSILVDGDEEGYLLQIFTKNLVGPIFFEIIQRKNHFGFGEGNFQQLFDAIERDQRQRGVL